MTNPALPPCLIRLYSSSPNQCGGTLIAENVVDLDTHATRLRDPDGYRPEICPTCGHDCLHAHDFRERKLCGELKHPAPVTFRRYRCAGCRAVWMVLAAFMSRHLHRRWSLILLAVTTALAGTHLDQQEYRLSRRTLGRWVQRLALPARLLKQALADILPTTGAWLEASTRWDLVEAMVRDGLLGAKRRLAESAAWLHRLVPGLRLM